MGFVHVRGVGRSGPSRTVKSRLLPALHRPSVRPHAAAPAGDSSPQVTGFAEVRASLSSPPLGREWVEVGRSGRSSGSSVRSQSESDSRGGRVLGGRGAGGRSVAVGRLQHPRSDSIARSAVLDPTWRARFVPHGDIAETPYRCGRPVQAFGDRRATGELERRCGHPLADCLEGTRRSRPWAKSVWRNLR